MFKDGIGLDAVNDSLLVEGSIYRLLRRHCRDQPYYVHLLELFNEASVCPCEVVVIWSNDEGVSVMSYEITHNYRRRVAFPLCKKKQTVCDLKSE